IDRTTLGPEGKSESAAASRSEPGQPKVRVRGSSNVMDLLSYDFAPFAVRSDLAEAHRRFWRRLARPGAWWTGVERVAIAAETRNARSCQLCRTRKSALSPNVISGEHDNRGTLPPPAVEAVHRIVSDPGRLSKPWLDSTLAAGLAVEAYVELVGT